MLPFGDASSGGAVQPHPSHPLHHSKPTRRQRQTIPAGGGILAGGVHGTSDGAAVPLSHGVAKFRNPKRILRRTNLRRNNAHTAEPGGCPTSDVA
jgi:hypothetical protein